MSLITAIQKYSIHDGDGIRTTVFFKGCALKCQWCHNPETQRPQQELLFDGDRCVGCGACARACPEKAVDIRDQKAVTDTNRCQVCGRCVDACDLNLRELAGKEYTVEELLKELKKDEMFYEESGGGVTLSGGEVMLADMDDVENLAKGLYKAGISVTIDTCGYAPYQNFERLLKYVDTFLYDIKMMDKEKHQRYVGVGNGEILSNLERISRNGAKIYIRIPVISGVNADRKSMEDILTYLVGKNVRVSQINLLPYHNTGISKYARLGLIYPGEKFQTPGREQMEQFADLFKEAGYKVKIGG